MTDARTTRATPVQSTAVSHSPSLSGVTGNFDQMRTMTRSAIAGTETATPVVQVTIASSQPP